MKTQALAAAFAVMLAFCNENRADNATPKPSGVHVRDVPPAADPSTAQASSAAVISAPDEAKQIASSRCATCHGASGKGDGPNSATLDPKPRDFTSKDWQKTMSDAQLRSVILRGGPALGKSVLMPANPDLESTPAGVDELVKIVRAYGA